MYEIEDAETLYAFLEEVVFCVQQIKCPICLELMKDPLETTCKHSFCSECITSHINANNTINTKPSCPVCRKTIRKRELHKSIHLEGLLSFVKGVNEKLNMIFGCQVTELKMLDIIKQKARPLTPSEVGLSDVIPASIDNTGIRNGVKTKNNKTQSQDAFNELLNTGIQNPLFKQSKKRTKNVNVPQSTYKKKRTKAETNVPANNPTDRDNNKENKSTILEWLSDERNKFENIVQTQPSEENAKYTQRSFDLPSVSQYRRQLVTLDANRTYKWNDTNKRRARSLDVEVKRHCKPRQKRHSISFGVSDNNVQIDDYSENDELLNSLFHNKVKKTAILKLMEEELANNIESEILPNDNCAASSGCQKASNKSSNSKWNDLKKTQKSIRRKETKTKKLHVKKCTQSAIKSSTNSLSITSVREKPQKIPVVLENIVMKECSNSNTPNKQAKCFALDVVEAYFNENISKPDVVQLLNNTNKNSEDKHLQNVEYMQQTADSNVQDNAGSLKHNEEFQKRNSGHCDSNDAVDSHAATSDHDLIAPQVAQENEEDVFMHPTQKLVVDQDLLVKDDIFVECMQAADNMVNKLSCCLKILSENCANPPDTLLTCCDKIRECVGNVKTAVTDLVQDRSLPEKAELRVLLAPLLDLLDGSFRCSKRVVCDVFNAHVQTEHINVKDIKTQTDFASRNAKTDAACSPLNLPKSQVDMAAEACVDLETSQVTTQTHRSNDNANVCREFLPCNLDNIDFNTQEIINGKKFSGASKLQLSSTIVEKQERVKTQTNFASRNAKTDATSTPLNLSKSQIDLLANASHDLETSQVTTQTYRSNGGMEFLSGNLDNLDFNTQEIINEKKFSDASKLQLSSTIVEKQERVKTQTNLASRNAKTDAAFSPLNLANSQIDTSAKTSHDLETSQVTTQTYRSNSGMEFLSGNLDNLDYSTQEIINNKKASDASKLQFNSSIVEKQERVKTQNEIELLKQPSLTPDVINTSLSNSMQLDVNCKFSYADGSRSRKFKRIRMPTGDSDSDEDIHRVKKCNRFVKDDLSICFVSEPAVTKDDSQLSNEIESFNYNVFLDNVMKKYDNRSLECLDSNSPTDSTIIARKNNSMHLQKSDTIAKCETIIEQTDQKHRELLTKNRSNTQHETQAKEVNVGDNVFNSDDVFSDETFLAAIERNAEETLKNKVTDDGNTKNVEVYRNVCKPKTKNNFSESLFINTENNNENAKNEKTETQLSLSLFTNSENYIKSLKRQASDKNAKQNFPASNIREEMPNTNTKTGMDSEGTNVIDPSLQEDFEPVKIRILNDVIIRNCVENPEDRMQVDNEDVKALEGVVSETDEEIFSDTDVVDTTPRKDKSWFGKERFSSQYLDAPIEIPPNNIQDALSCNEADLGIILPPPVEFQCDDDKTLVDDAEDNQLVKPNLSNTPDFLPFSPERHALQRENASILGTSTPLSYRNRSQRVLNLSPIKPKESVEVKPIKPRQLLEPDNRSGAFSRMSPLTVVIKTPVEPKKPPVPVPKQQQSILNYLRMSQETKASTAEFSSKKPCITCSRLSKNEVIAISSLTNKKLAVYSNNFGPNVTHVVVAVNEQNCVKNHTIKFVCAVAAGIWVVNFQWVQECLKRNCIVDEEPYEVLDISGVDGPKQSRLTRNEKSLLKGYKIYPAPPFVSTTQTDVENVVKMLGGKVVYSPDELLCKNGDVCLIITEARATQDFEIYEGWLEALKVATVDIEWLTRSVGQWKLLSVRPFTLCSDDSLYELGYPQELLLNVPLSFSQSTL